MFVQQLIQTYIKQTLRPCHTGTVIRKTLPCRDGPIQFLPCYNRMSRLRLCQIRILKCCVKLKRYLRQDSKMKKKVVLHYVELVLQTHYHFKFDFQKVDQHTGGKWQRIPFSDVITIDYLNLRHKYISYRVGFMRCRYSECSKPLMRYTDEIYENAANHQ